MSHFRWMSPVVAALCVGCAAAPDDRDAPAGTAAGNGNASAELAVEAPMSVNPPIDLWQVKLGSLYHWPAPSPSDYVKEVNVHFTAPADGPGVSDLEISLDGPGVFAPPSRRRIDQLEAGESATATWRWAAPVKNQVPPYSLALRATATFTAGAGQANTNAQAQVDVEPPPAPTEDVFLSDLQPAYAGNGFGPIERDMNVGEYGPNDGEPIRMGGKTFEKGLGMHAHGVAGYYLGGNGDRFTATIGLDEDRGNGGSVIFRVVADGEVVFESDVITGATSPQEISVDVGGVERLELIADATDDGQGGDWANWADARLTCK